MASLIPKKYIIYTWVQKSSTQWNTIPAPSGSYATMFHRYGSHDPSPHLRKLNLYLGFTLLELLHDTSPQKSLRICNGLHGRYTQGIVAAKAYLENPLQPFREVELLKNIYDTDIDASSIIQVCKVSSTNGRRFRERPRLLRFHSNK